MARPKGAKNKKKETTKLDPMVEEIVEVEVEFDCPKRGKVKQKVKMKRLKAVNNESRPLVGPREEVDTLDGDDDGLSIYDGTDEEGNE